jgi:HEAT repeats
MHLIRIFASLLAFASAVGCSAAENPDAQPLTPEEIARRAESARSEPLDIKGRSQLVTRLDQTLIQWYSAQFSSRTAADRELAKNLADVLHSTVYKHFPDVLDFLLHGDQYQQKVAAAAIGFARPDPEALADAAADPDRGAIYAPAAESTEYRAALDPLIDLLASDDNQLVQNALLGLWRLRDPDTQIEPILRLLVESPDPDVRGNAALALSSIVTAERGADVIDVLLTATNDRSARVRVHAITALAATQHPAATGRLLKLLDDPYELIQANAARAIGTLGDKRNCGALVLRLENLDRTTPDGKSRKPTDLDHRRSFLRGYLIESLQILSGETYGDDVEKWREWWDETRDEARS